MKILKPCALHLVAAEPLSKHPFMTSSEAAAYCGFKSTGALHAARKRGDVRPIGQRGGVGWLVWAREELDRFLTYTKPPQHPRFTLKPIDVASVMSVGGVYFAGGQFDVDGRQLVKIGWSAESIGWRIESFRTGNPSVTLMAYVPNAPQVVERKMHKRFAESRAGGEWFYMSHELLSEIISRREAAK